MTPSYHPESDQPIAGALLRPGPDVQKWEHIGPPWATACEPMEEGVVFWHYECQTQVDIEDFDHPGAPPFTTIVRIERIDGITQAFVPAAPGVPAAVEATVEQGQDMIVIDVMGNGERPFPELRMTRRQAEQLGKALAEAVTVHYERTHDVYPDRAGASPLEGE